MTTISDARATRLIAYLDYVVNTGGNGTIETFDDDYAPIGPSVRDELMPKYIDVNAHGRLILTPDGERIRNAAPRR